MNIQSRYCLPIIKDTREEVLATIEKFNSKYGFFEVWLDYINNIDNDFISDLLSNYEQRLVFVFRRKDMSETRLDENKKIKIFGMLANKSCLIDLDVHHQKNELSHAKNLNLIVSYHNYEKTPANSELSDIIDEIKSYSPEVVKISTMCNSDEDALRLINSKRILIDENQKHIILGMGEAGKITRVFGALWGNELIFIPENADDASAPGQISRQEFDEIIERVKS